MMAPSGATARDSPAGRPICGLVVLHPHRQLVDHLDALDRAPHAGRGGGERARAHLALEAELHVVRGELVAVVERLAGPQIEGPGQAVGRELPAFGDAGADAAFFEVEADQRVVHHRLVDRIARPAFEDRIERLGAERFDGEDERALLVLGAEAAPWRQRSPRRRELTALPMCRSISSSLNVDFDFVSWVSADGDPTIRGLENLSIAAADQANQPSDRPRAGHPPPGGIVHLLLLKNRSTRLRDRWRLAFTDLWE